MTNRVASLSMKLCIVFLFSCSFHNLAASSGSPEYTSGPIRFTDSLGREVGLDSPPQRVLLAGKAVVFSTNTIYLFPAAKRLVVGTGTTDQGLGDIFPILDPKAAEKLRYANNVGPEQLITANPDLVVLKYYLRENLGVALEGLGIPVVYFNSENPESFYSDVTMFGALFNDDVRAKDIISYYQSKYGSIIDKTANIDKPIERPPVLLVSYSSRDGDSAFSVPSSGWLQTRLVDDGGGTPVWKNVNSGGGWKK